MLGRLVFTGLVTSKQIYVYLGVRYFFLTARGRTSKFTIEYRVCVFAVHLMMITVFSVFFLFLSPKMKRRQT